MIPNRHYLRVNIILTPALNSLTAPIFRSLLNESVRSLFGIVGVAQYQIDLLSFDGDENTAIIAIEANHVIPIRSAFALCGQTESQRQCQIRVLQSSAFLASLAADSRRG